MPSLKVRLFVALAGAVLSIALTVGIIAGVREEAAGQRRSALEQYGGETISVCVSTKDIARGEVFSERNVERVEWLVDLLPEGAVVDYASLMGETAASAMAKNTPIARVDVDLAGPSLDVPAGMVAVSVPCTNESAVGGALAMGSVVDAYVVSEGTARLLCSEVQVLETNASGTSASLSWATIAVEPSQVEAVIAASGLQRLYFVLPSEEELERRSVEAVARADCVGGGESPGAPGVAEGPMDAGDEEGFLADGQANELSETV